MVIHVLTRFLSYQILGYTFFVILDLIESAIDGVGYRVRERWRG